MKVLKGVAVSCLVCEKEISAPLFESLSGHVLTSLSKLHPGNTRVYFCESCEHLQTKTFRDVDEYYDQGYDILVQGEEEDNLYEVRGDHKIFRSDHQLETLLKNLDLKPGASILDYGCAKGAVLKKLIKKRPDLKAHFFDVSQNYLPFWQGVVPEEQYACYELPERWRNSLDYVVSFFVLEHVENPLQVLRAQAEVLKPGGVLYFLVPNVYENSADFIVADHLSHFSPKSLESILSHTGFQLMEINTTDHAAAFIVTAKKKEVNLSSEVSDYDSVRKEVREIAEYWAGAADKIQSFEKEVVKGEPAAIYGAGFYGTYIASCLKQLENIECFFDQNPFVQGSEIFERPVKNPKAISSEIKHVYVGLNPKRAQGIIASVEPFKGKELNFCFL